MRNEWDEKKSLQQNMNDMGLVADANTLISIKKTKVRIKYFKFCFTIYFTQVINKDKLLF